MRIGLVSQWYAPERGAGTMPTTMAHGLRDLGHDVRVLTGYPNYPTGRLYPGYRQRPCRREILDGIPVHRAPLYPSHDRSGARRAVNYLSFAAAGSVVGLAALAGVDAVLVYSSPITAAAPAMTARAVRHIPYVLLIGDMWPESVTASGFLPAGSTGRTERILNRLCDAVYTRASAIAVTSPGMAAMVAARGIPEPKISFVPVCVDERPPAPGTADLGPLWDFTVMYAGNLGQMQGLEVVLAAATRLQAHTDIGFVLVGSGVAEPALRAGIASLGLDNVRLAGHQPADRMPAVLRLGDVQLISLRDIPVFRHTLPSKLQAALAQARPVICAVAGDAADIVAASGAGETVAPGSADELAAAVLRLQRLGPTARAALGAAGRAYYERNLGREVSLTRLEGLLAAPAERR